MHRVVLAVYFAFSLAAAPASAPASGAPVGVQEFVDPLGSEPLEPIGAPTAGATEAASSEPESGPAATAPPTTAPGPTPDAAPTLPADPGPADEPDPPTAEPASPAPATTASDAGPLVAIGTEAASPDAVAAAPLLETAPSAVAGSVGLGDLAIGPEQPRPSPLPDRPRWTDAVDDALGWRTDACKFAYYAVGPRDCGGNVHRDHLVAWAEAWDSGLSYADAEGWYLDDDNLWVMPGGENISKSDDDPAEWRPQDPADWCRYARDWIAVKDAWDLTVDRAEADALREMLSTCTGAPPEPADTLDAAPRPEPADTPDAAQPTEPAADSPGPPSPDPDLDELLQELRSTPCGEWGAEERALARQAPAGFDWGRRDGDNDGTPCDG